MLPTDPLSGIVVTAAIRARETEIAQENYLRGLRAARKVVKMTGLEQTIAFRAIDALIDKETTNADTD